MGDKTGNESRGHIDPSTLLEAVEGRRDVLDKFWGGVHSAVSCGRQVRRLVRLEDAHGSAVHRPQVGYRTPRVYCGVPTRKFVRRGVPHSWQRNA